MGGNPVSQRECDVRFEVVKEIREDVRSLSKTMTDKVDEMKQTVGTLCTQMSTLETQQGNLSSQQKNHVETHSKGTRNKAAWLAAISALVIAALALVFGILSHT